MGYEPTLTAYLLIFTGLWIKGLQNFSTGGRWVKLTCPVMFICCKYWYASSVVPIWAPSPSWVCGSVPRLSTMLKCPWAGHPNSSCSLYKSIMLALTASASWMRNRYEVHCSTLLICLLLIDFVNCSQTFGTFSFIFTLRHHINKMIFHRLPSFFTTAVSELQVCLDKSPLQRTAQQYCLLSVLGSWRDLKHWLECFGRHNTHPFIAPGYYNFPPIRAPFEKPQTSIIHPAVAEYQWRTHQWHPQLSTLFFNDE